MSTRIIHGIEIGLMLAGYLECALWASMDNADEQGGEPLDANYGFEDFDPATLKEAAEQCAAFLEENAEDFAVSRADASQWGHDFFLTRNHHGAGFWDRGDDLYPADMRKRLTDAAHVWGTWQPYLGDNGKLYAHG